MKSRVLIAIASGWVLFSNLPAFAGQATAASPSLNSLSARTLVEPLSTNRDSQPAITNKAAAFQLKPTGIAPAGTGGSAELKGNTLALHLSHLGQGSYELRGVRRAGGVREQLGTFTIVDPTLSPDHQANDNKKEASAEPDQVRVDTEVQVTLPAGAGLQDIRRIEVLDAGGNTVLAGNAD